MDDYGQVLNIHSYLFIMNVRIKEEKMRISLYDMITTRGTNGKLLYKISRTV